LEHASRYEVIKARGRRVFLRVPTRTRDIRGFYDAMSHAWIIRFLEHLIADKRILRLVAKWLKVGIIEDGRVTRSQVGAPQGAVISPILANVYLHYAYDLWIQRWRPTKANGDVIVVRYADDQSSVSSTSMRQRPFCRTCTKDCVSSNWRCTRTRPG